jgi:hypothetical protein
LYWHHWFQATKRGTEAIARDPKGFARIMWDTWSPPGWFDERTFSQGRCFFRQSRLGCCDQLFLSLAVGRSPFDPRSVKIETRIRTTKRLNTPTVFFHGASPPFERIALHGVGHFPTREVPKLIGKRLVDHFTV